MKTRAEKYEAILALATELDANGKTKTFLELGKHLNKSGFRNQRGERYAANPRGIAKVVSYAYAYAETNFGERKALPIANSFTGASGEYAWSE